MPDTHVTRIYLPYVTPTSKVFDRAARGSETRPANVVSTRSSRNLGNFFRIPSLREAIARTFRCPSGSQSCGFGKPATSKLLLFQNLRSLLSLAIRLICNINFGEVDYPFCHRATLSRSLHQFLVSILD